MKAVYISCNVSTTHIVTEILDNASVAGYQIFDNVAVRLPLGNHRMNNAVWPGYNNVVFVQAIDDAAAATLIEALKEYNRNAFNKDELISVSVWNVDAFFFGEVDDLSK
ncbi:MAG TPA: hypothetical protein PLM49_00820 [Bacteroidales bacterium]|nr:hypothetical protein [Bacteroidales bacterium]